MSTGGAHIDKMITGAYTLNHNESQPLIGGMDMLINQRRAQILALLQREKFVTVAWLCRSLYASPATIRRDLAEMEEQGSLLRMRGGAGLPEGSNSDMPLLLRTQKEREKKETIAALAAHYAESASTIFMDSSSTVYYLARQLRNYGGKSVITSGLATLNYLNEQTGAVVYCTGGRLLNQSSFVGPQSTETVRGFFADVLFFSCCGFSAENGPTDAEEENAIVKRAMLSGAKRKILLCDSTKFGPDFFCRICRTGAVDLLITDRKPGEAVQEALGDKLVWGGALP